MEGELESMATRRRRKVKPSVARAGETHETVRTPEVVAAEIAKATDTDIIFYNGSISRPCDEALIRSCMQRKGRRRKRVMLILVTYGGDPDAGYRIARCLQNSYEHFSVYVPGACKSAGTLIAVGANELVISDHGELGPLDIQMPKKDEFFDSQSGLTIVSALNDLESRIFEAAQRMIFQIEANTGGMLTVQTATNLAAQLVVGLYAPVASQIDPMHIGEATRSLLIAESYGTRLARYSENLRSLSALRQLYSQYPSHGFVIDRAEAELFFKNVREPSQAELELVELMGPFGRRVRPAKQGPVNADDTVHFLSPDLETEELEDAEDVSLQNGDSDGTQE